MIHKIGKYFPLGIISSIIGVIVGGILFIAFSSVLDFFPWGNSGAYVLWGPLTLVIFLPLVLLPGIFNIVFMGSDRTNSCGICTLSPILASFLILLPVFMSDSGVHPNFAERWTGVVTSLFVALMFLWETKYWIQHRRHSA